MSLPASALHPTAIGIEAILTQTRGLAAFGDRVELATPVPTCGSWTMADLLWHLTDVQRFWIYIIGERADGPAEYERPKRPADDGVLADGLRATVDSLVGVLDGLDPAEPAWSWAEDQTVGFTLRRQSHEALIHHLDGALAAGQATVDATPELWADGVDELLTVMLGTTDPSFRARGPVAMLRAVDTGDRWVARTGVADGTTADGEEPPTEVECVQIERLPGPNAADGDGPDGVAAEVETEGTVVSGSAAALDRWLWGRPGSGSTAVDLGRRPEHGRELRRIAGLAFG